AIEQRPAVAELLAGEHAVPVGIPARELAGQGGAITIFRGGHVPVAVLVEDVEGAALPLPLRAGDAAVAVAVLAVEAIVTRIVAHPAVGAGARVAGGGEELVPRHGAVAVAVRGAEGDALSTPFVAGEQAVVVAVELAEALIPHVPVAGVAVGVQVHVFVARDAVVAVAVGVPEGRHLSSPFSRRDVAVPVAVEDGEAIAGRSAHGE